MSAILTRRARLRARGRVAKARTHYCEHNVKGFRRAVKYFSANNTDPYNPEVWAKTSLIILFNNMPAHGLVHTDFNTDIANFGDTVNTRQPSQFTARRVDSGTAITLQDIAPTNVPILLNHHPHSSYPVYDMEQSHSFKDLVAEYMFPAALSIAEYVDRMLIGQTYGFLTNVVGYNGCLTSSNALTWMANIRTKLNTNKVPMAPRSMLLGSTTEGTFLQDPNFVLADSVGDRGEALAKAFLGEKLGISNYLSQAVPDVAANVSTSVQTVLINNGAGYPIGTTTLVIDGAGATATNILPGSWVSIGGQPYQVVSTSGGPPFTGLVLATGLRRAVADNDVITAYTPGAVNFAAGYLAGYTGSLVVDAFTVAPQVGQGITFGTYGGPVYMVTAATTTSVTIDRPLEAAVADNAVVGVLPYGAYNPFFHRNAMTMVNRMLPIIGKDMGVKCGGSSFNKLTMRVTMGYDMTYQRQMVTFDALYGSKILNTALGGVFIS